MSLVRLSKTSLKRQAPAVVRCHAGATLLALGGSITDLMTGLVSAAWRGPGSSLHHWWTQMRVTCFRPNAHATARAMTHAPRKLADRLSSKRSVVVPRNGLGGRTQRAVAESAPPGTDWLIKVLRTSEVGFLYAVLIPRNGKATAGFPSPPQAPKNRR